MKKSDAVSELLAEWRIHPFTPDVYAACRQELQRLEEALVAGDGKTRSLEDEAIRTIELRAKRDGLLHFLDNLWVSDLADRDTTTTDDQEEVNPYETE